MNNKQPVRTLDDEVEGEIRDESPQTKAVSALIDIKERSVDSKGKTSRGDVELKTDLTDQDTCSHTVVEFMNELLRFDRGKSHDFDIAGVLVEKKERKLLSLNRKSRIEIVNVARQPDVSMMDDNVKKGLWSKMVTPRQ
jgi:hypothetical protein